MYGLENLPPTSETVVYVPNHTNFFDILVLSGRKYLIVKHFSVTFLFMCGKLFLIGYMPRPIKYLSKSDILNIPLVRPLIHISYPP